PPRHLVHALHPPHHHPPQQPTLQPRLLQPRPPRPAPALHAPPLQPPAAARPSIPPPLLPPPRLPAPLLGNLRYPRPLRATAPRSPLPHPDHPAIPLLYPPTGQEIPPQTLRRRLAPLQYHLRRADGLVSPGRRGANAIPSRGRRRRDARAVVENLFPARVAPKWEERGPHHARPDGYARGGDDRGATRAGDV
ncbi:hypothetical protein V493_01743, partial [Pseudogymnoascus sp. VKM F-4281 (FW-2241)]